MAVKFYITNSNRDRDHEVAIFVSISICGSRFVTSTGIKLDPNKWDKIAKKPKKGVYNKNGQSWAQMLSRMADIQNHFYELENRFTLSGHRPTSAELRAEFNNTFRKSKASQHIESVPYEDTFWGFYDEFIAERGTINSWTNATKQKFDALKQHITLWKKEPTFEDFTEEGLNKFIVSMRDKEGLKNSTIGKQIGFLKWFLRWATSKGHNTNLAYQSFTVKLKTAQRKVVFLEWDELMKVYNYDIPKNGEIVELQKTTGEKYLKIISDASALKKTRDIFCFCCFTSLRYSDVNNLKRADISDNKISLTTIKTADTIVIELNKYALSILEKYKNIDSGEYVFPRITNQRMNLYLKELCELCGINQPITQTYYSGNRRIDETKPKYEWVGTHTGRRTFICNALILGIPVTTVMKWTGHADYKSMQPYIDVADSAKAEAMKLFDKL